MCTLTCLHNYGYAWALIYFCLFIFERMLAASSGCARSSGYLVFSPPVWLFLAPFAWLGHTEAEPSVSITQSHWWRCRGLVALTIQGNLMEMSEDYILLLFW